MPKLSIKEIESIQRKLKAGETVPAMIHDGSGLYLRCRKTGGMSFVVRRWGFPLLTLGTVDMGLVNARKEAAKALALQAQGIDPSQAKREAKLAKQAEVRETVDTFDDVLDRYVERHCKPSLRTWREVERILRKDASPAFGRMPIQEVTKRQISKLLDDVVDRGSPIVAISLQSKLHALLQWAVGRGYIEHNPVASMPKIAVKVARDRALSDEEIKLVWQATGILGWPYLTIFRLLLLTGQRRSEIAEGRWSEVDLEQMVWRLPAARVKNKTQHQFPLSSAVISLLKGAPRTKGTDLIFTHGGSNPPVPVTSWRYSKNKIDKQIKSLNGGVAIQPWTIHDLRRTAATGMASINVAPHIIEAVLNHKSGAKTGVAGIYNRHGYESEMRSALEAWAQRLSEIVSGKDDK